MDVVMGIKFLVFDGDDVLTNVVILMELIETFDDISSIVCLLDNVSGTIMLLFTDPPITLIRGGEQLVVVGIELLWIILGDKFVVC
jgi:hypothetical protein